MRAWHIRTHFVDESMARLGSVFGGCSCALILTSHARWTMLHAKHNIEELDQGTLRVTAAAVLLLPAR